MGERLYYVLQIIKDSKKAISAKDIQEKLLQYHVKVDIKTIYGLIHKINQFYYPILQTEYIRTIHKKGYCIEHEYFEDGQLQYLVDSILFNPNLSKDEGNELLTRLLTMSSANQKDRITLNETKSNHQDFSLLLNLNTLLKAINAKQNIYFEYVNYQIENNTLKEISSLNGNIRQGDKSYYIISPYQVVLRGSNYYLIGYFNQRKDTLSMYRVDRMRMIRQHASKFVEIREQYDMEQEIESNINMFISDKHIDIVFRFKNSILREVVNQFGQDIKVEKHSDGWNQATIKEVALSNGLIGWIFMLQEQIEIVYPLDLRNTIIQKLEQLATIYNRG